MAQEFDKLPEAGYCITCLRFEGTDDEGGYVCAIREDGPYSRSEGHTRCPKWRADEIMCSIMSA